MRTVDRASPLSHRGHRDKLLRFAGVSVMSTIVTQAMLFALVDGAHVAGAPANVVTVAITATGSYLLNRAWVWGHRDAHSFHREILPYWGMTGLGLVLSTLFAWFAYRHVARAGWAVSLANVAGFGLIWGLKYVVLDRVVFHPERRAN